MRAITGGRAPAELVAPAKLKVMTWKKDEQRGVVVKDAGGPHSGGNPGLGNSQGVQLVRY